MKYRVMLRQAGSLTGKWHFFLQVGFGYLDRFFRSHGEYIL
jgi:hypothetical protein